MTQRRLNSFDFASLIVSVALVLVGYLLGLVKVEPFLIGVAIVATVVVMAAFIAGLITRKAHTQGLDDIEEALREHATSLTASITTEQRSLNAPVIASNASLDAAVNESLKRVERAIFDHLAAFDARRDTPSGGSAVSAITRVQAGAIEAMAEEVWVYAYDMAWDVEEQVLGGAVENNLREAVRYRFLIPDRDDVKARVRVLVSRLRKVPDLENQLKFRVRHEEVPFAKFAISIYNPHYERTLDERLEMTRESCVILFPHFGRVRPDQFDPFVKLSGPITMDYQLEFSRIWQTAQPYSPDPLEAV